MFGWFRRHGPIRVIDADTISRDEVTYRLMGYDSPEIARARSDHERSMGERAAARLQELIAPPNKVKLTPIDDVDNHGRGLAHLYINGRDVAQIAIEEGWGIHFDGERRKSRDMPDWSTHNY